GTVVRRPLSPLSLLLLLDELLCELELCACVRGEGRRSSPARGAGAGGGLLLACSCGCCCCSFEAEAGATSRLFSTTFTPSTCAASSPAAFFVASLLTVPVSVTVPLLALILSCLSGILLSPLILFCTSDATCASVCLLTREHPAANSARETRTTQRFFFINFCS